MHPAQSTSEKPERHRNEVLGKKRP